jgi:hypothetical protein
LGQSTLGAQAIQGMFVGYEPGSKAYRVRVGRKVYVSFDVRFLEHQSGARAAGVERLDTHNPSVDFGGILHPIPHVEKAPAADEFFMIVLKKRRRNFMIPLMRSVMKIQLNQEKQ